MIHACILLAQFLLLSFRALLGLHPIIKAIKLKHFVYRTDSGRAMPLFTSVFASSGPTHLGANMYTLRNFGELGYLCLVLGQVILLQELFHLFTSVRFMWL